MKTKTDITTTLYVILLALRESKSTPLGGIPNGHLYAQLMEHWDIADWNILIDGMLTGNIQNKGPLITQRNYLLKITAAGEIVLSQLEAIYNEQKGVGK